MHRTERRGGKIHKRIGIGIMKNKIGNMETDREWKLNGAEIIN